MSARIFVLTPALKPVGGVVKIFDYVEHLMAFGFRPVICTDDEFDEDLPLFRDNRYPEVRPESGVPYTGLSEFGLEHDDWVLFSWPTNYDEIARRFPRGFDQRRVIHLVQNVRHANPRWIGGYATRLLARPMTRIFVATPVFAVSEPYLNPHGPSIVIPEGHRWEYFEQARQDAFSTPIRVAYTTWKSGVGDRVANMFKADDRFEFRAIRRPAGWPELRDLYQWSDIFLATPGPEEGFYLPGLEAMAAGSIVITPDVGGNMEYCDFNVNCLPVELESEESYAEALERISGMAVREVSDVRRAAYATLQRHTLIAEKEALGQFISGVETSLAEPPEGTNPGKDQSNHGSTSTEEVVSYLEELVVASEQDEAPPVDPRAVRARLHMPYQEGSLSRFPDFLGIGAQKGGTTWLHRSFESHPEVWVPGEKELHYFDEKFGQLDSIRRPPLGDEPEAERWRRQMRRQLLRYENGQLDDRDLSWLLTYFLEQPSDEWYAHLFSGRHSAYVVGELTPDYSTLPIHVIRHIYTIMPGTKIIFFMRNPIERAWSQAAMSMRLNNHGHAQEDDQVEQVLASERSRQLTNYTAIIDSWTSVFPRNQFFLGYLEDIAFMPGELLRRLYRFLGVSEDQERYRVLNQRVHSGDIETIGAANAYFLAELYLPLLEELEERFGGYASGWLHVACSVLERGPDGPDIPYPFWQWEPWREWAGLSGDREPDPGQSEKVRAQSSPLR